MFRLLISVLGLAAAIDRQASKKSNLVANVDTGALYSGALRGHYHRHAPSRLTASGKQARRSRSEQKRHRRNLRRA